MLGKEDLGSAAEPYGEAVLGLGQKVAVRRQSRDAGAEGREGTHLADGGGPGHAGVVVGDVHRSQIRGAEEGAFVEPEARVLLVDEQLEVEISADRKADDQSLHSGVVELQVEAPELVVVDLEAAEEAMAVVGRDLEARLLRRGGRAGRCDQSGQCGGRRVVSCTGDGVSWSSFLL